jgi:CubicO group peptidase (beta-lactamase class C family)
MGSGEALLLTHYKKDMIKEILLPLLMLVANATFGQIADIATHTIVKDSFVAKFNRGDFKAVYAMADTGFRSGFSENDMVKFLESFTSLGKIMNSSFLKDGAETKEYRLYFPKRSLQLILGVKDHQTFESFGLNYYKLPIDTTRTSFLSDNPLRSRLDTVVQNAVRPYMSNSNVCGLSIGILKDGAMYFYDYGETEKGNGKLPANNSIYEIGSITKTFTGLLLANAVREGRAALTDDIRKYLEGDFPDLQFAGQPIQLVHLSNHTSRLPSQPLVYGTNQSLFDPSIKYNQAILTDVLHHVKIDTLPGTKAEYSNFAVGLLGTVLEKIYGLTYEEILHRFITQPYRMVHTKISLAKPDFERYAQGYDEEGNPASYWRNQPAEPAGGVRSTAKDMLVYIGEQLNRNNNSTTLTHQLTFGNEKRGRGLGWSISTTREGNHLRWSHDGGTDGFTSLCLIYPELDAGIILLTNNGDHGNVSFYDIGRAIYQSWVK